MYRLSRVRLVRLAVLLICCSAQPQAQTLSDAVAQGQPLGLSVGVSGQVAEVLVQAGDEVKQGQHLLSLEAKTYQATLDAARMTQSQTRFEAQLVEEDFERQQELYDEGSLSTVELQFLELKVKQARSGLATANAAVAVAEANLQYTRIQAPVAGQIIAVPVVGQRVSVAQGLPVLIKLKPR